MKCCMFLRYLNSGVELEQTLIKQCRYSVRRPYLSYDIKNAIKSFEVTSRRRPVTLVA